MKLQPVFLGLGFAIIAFWLQASGKPVLLLALDKYASLLPATMENAIANPSFRDLLKQVSFYLGFGFLMHASLVGYAAFRMNNWWWLIIRGIGLYVMMAMCVVCARLF